MRITEVLVRQYRVPAADRTLFDGSYDSCVVEIRTDEGLIGRAEVDSVPSVIAAIVSAPPSHSSARGLREILVGQDALAIEALWARMYEATSYYGRRGVVMHAIGAVDVALWDLCGLAEQTSVGRLLGGRRRERVRAWATIYPTGPTPDELRRQLVAAQAVGLRDFKLVADPWWRTDPHQAVRLLHTARHALGPKAGLALDAAGLWHSVNDALPILSALEQLGFAWLEAPLPVDDVEGHSAFRRSTVPIAGGDLGLTSVPEFTDLMDRGNVDIVQADVAMSGVSPHGRSWLAPCPIAASA